MKVFKIVSECNGCPDYDDSCFFYFHVEKKISFLGIKWWKRVYNDFTSVEKAKNSIIKYNPKGALLIVDNNNEKV